jgi:molybdopterin-containing oxidoreductase family iron-sulfur binding subunit
MAKYGMAIDLKRCYGCYACVMACKAENFTPPGVFWARLLKGETGEFPNTVRQALPVLCMHCDDPSCLTVCPTKATYQDDDGVVYVDKDKCIGCNYCAMACPYGARYMVEKWEGYFPEEIPLTEYDKLAKQMWEAKSGVGVSTKCDFCKTRRDSGEMEPSCVRACPALARTFGDLDDPNSEISVKVRRGRAYVLNPELGNKPKVHYIPPR